MAKLGHMGETVRVKDGGFARNFLLPRGKALRATENNKKKFESQRAELEVRNQHLQGGRGERNRPSWTDLLTRVIIQSRGRRDLVSSTWSVSARRHRRNRYVRRRGLFDPSQSRSLLPGSRSRRSACTRRRSTCIPRSRAHRDDQRLARSRRAGRTPVQGRGSFRCA